MLRSTTARLRAATGLLASVCLCAAGEAVPSRLSPQAFARVTDLAGRPLSHAPAADARVTVLIFLSTDCPICNSYAPEYRRLVADFAPAGVTFLGVYCDRSESEAALRQHRKDYELPFETVRDPQQDLARLASATITPEAAVFTPGDGLVYHGRIDDRHVRLGLARPAATRRDLREVLQAVLAGRPSPESSAPAVGCSIPRLP